MDHDDIEDAQEVSITTNMRNTNRVQCLSEEETTYEVTTSRNRAKGRKRKADDVLTFLVGKLDQIVDSMIDPKMRHTRELLAAIKAFSNLSEEILLTTYKHLLQNETEADLFLARNEDSKQNWLYNFML
jgi:hypothetical protein